MTFADLMAAKMYGNHHADRALLDALDTFIRNPSNSTADRAACIRRLDDVMGFDGTAFTDDELVAEFMQQIEESFDAAPVATPDRRGDTITDDTLDWLVLHVVACDDQCERTSQVAFAMCDAIDDDEDVTGTVMNRRLIDRVKAAIFRAQHDHRIARRSYTTPHAVRLYFSIV